MEVQALEAGSQLEEPLSGAGRDLRRTRVVSGCGLTPFLAHCGAEYLRGLRQCVGVVVLANAATASTRLAS
jgi:hypothetical protein